MIRIRVTEHQFGVLREVENPQLGTEWLPGKPLCRDFDETQKVLLHQEVDGIDITALIAFVNQLDVRGPCTCGHPLRAHEGRCKHGSGYDRCECKRYVPPSEVELDKARQAQLQSERDKVKLSDALTVVQTDAINLSKRVKSLERSLTRARNANKKKSPLFSTRVRNAAKKARPKRR